MRTQAHRIVDTDPSVAYTVAPGNRRSSTAVPNQCFVVRPGFRRRGLMHRLLDGAVGHAHAMGATALEGYPVDLGSEPVDQTAGHVGTVPLFEAHGFSRVCQTAGHSGGKPRWLVRRVLP